MYSTDKVGAMKKVFIYTILFLFTLASSSCLENNGVKKSRSFASKSQGGNSSGNTGLPTDNSLGDGSNTAILSSKVELTHLVDPFDGTYKKKLTVPRNYKGFMYIAGLNLSVLKGKILKVRFYLGRDRQPVVLNATVARAPGITPKTDIEVLVVDMASRPFLKTRLPYDLYDYNSYDGASNTADFVANNLDGGLYCRGLRSEDDPTFTATDAQPTCSNPGSICKYSYAKVVDSTFYDSATGLSFVPTLPSAFVGIGYAYSQSYFRNMCIPDTNDLVQVAELFNPGSSTIGYDSPFATYADNLNTTTTPQFNTYKGPFRFINQLEWDINSSAISDNLNSNTKAGLFENCSGNWCWGSYLFPRQGKLENTSGYKAIFGSNERFGSRSMVSPNSSATSISSIFVDGCNIRALNYNSSTGLGIGSCNVSANIELFYVNDGKEIKITSEKSLKIQLVRDSLTNSEGKEVLSGAFSNCSSSSMCGSSECCFNKRCWSKDLVTQCLDEVPGTGNEEIGSSCTSDYQCGSLCCNQSTGTCAPHSTTGSTPILCSKSPGQQCISREYCRKEFVTTCKVYKDGVLNADGTPKCSIRCLPVQTYSDCKNGLCVPPPPPADPADPEDPEVCAAAPVYQ